jgi:hypothetical protein
MEPLFRRKEATTRTCYSVSPPLSHRPHSTGGTLESISSHGKGAIKSPIRTTINNIGKRRRDSFRVSRLPRQLSASACHQMKIKNDCIPRREIKTHQDFATRPELQRSFTSPVVGHANTVDSQRDNQSSENQNELHHTQPQIKELIENEDVDMAEAVAQEAQPYQMFKQLETHSITEEQLINEVKGIYKGLVMVEKKCIEIDKQQMESKAELSTLQWQALGSAHKTLLYEHHDFLLASQHPSAGPVLKHLAEKYAMPARMWRYAIHSFLELMRQKLPGSIEYMLDFIYFSYSMMTLLLESVSGFKVTWIECLGDLARYRMAAEEFDKRDRDLWAGVSRYWYNQDAEHTPETGRIQHHLAVLARSDVLQQIFHYTKALISIRPFPNARDSMVQVITPHMNVPTKKQNLITSFVAAHGALITQAPAEEFVSRSSWFLSTLQRDINHLGRQGLQGVQIVSCNIAAIFQYGHEDGVMAKDFPFKNCTASAEDYRLSMEWASGATPIKATYTDISSQLAFRASSLAFHTLIVMLGQSGDPNMYPGVHISMAFVWCLTLNPAAIQRLEPLVPWMAVASYLNGLFTPDTDLSKIENELFPLLEDTAVKQLPEDFLIRGQAWSRLYYPEKFFEGAPCEDERPSIEQPSTVISRLHRCLWLGVRIATVCLALQCFITFYQTELTTTSRSSLAGSRTTRQHEYSRRLG